MSSQMPVFMRALGIVQGQLLLAPPVFGGIAQKPLGQFNIVETANESWRLRHSNAAGAAPQKQCSKSQKGDRKPAGPIDLSTTE